MTIPPIKAKSSFSQGNPKVEDPGKGLIRVTGEAPELASDVRDVM